MNRKIQNFRKTDHFLLGQWDRSIDDQLLGKILPFIESNEFEKRVVLVLPSFLRKKGFGKDDETCLVLIVKRNLIVTGYWCDHPNYLFNKEKNSFFKIIY